MTKVRSYGSVFLASRNDGEGTVAIKQAKLGHKSSMNHVTSEITMLSYLSHPNVIKLEDCFLFENEEESGDQTLWMVLEYMNGGAIARLLRKKSTTKVLWWLSEPEVAYVTKQILAGLIYLHKQDIFHRDLKLLNVLTDFDGNVKLVDFGFAHFSWKGSAGSFPGSTYWEAPEILTQQDYGLEVDIWALGIVVRELAEGMPPYYEGYGESEAQKNIVEYGIYGFDEPERWTKEMIEFTELCLTYEQDKRPTAAELWKNACTKEEWGATVKKAFANAKMS